MRIAIWWEQELWGGVDTHLQALLENWPEKTDSFVIFYNQGNQGIARILSALESLDYVSLVPIRESKQFLPKKIKKVINYIFLPVRFLAMKGKARKILSLYGSFDVLLSNNGGYPGAWSNLAVLWAGKKQELPVRMLLVHHEAVSRGPLRATFESLVDLGVQYWATDLVTVSRATRESLIERRGFYSSTLNPIRVIHNGINLDVNDAVETVDLKKKLNIQQDAFVIGMIGRIERYKGHEDLLLALSEINTDLRRNIIFVIVGDGNEAEKIRLNRIAEKLGVSENVRFAGYIEGSSSKVINNFDVLAMLTKDFEGFGLTIAEAMSVGTTVLCTSVGAVPEFVTEDIAYMVHPEAPDEIAERLSEIINNPEIACRRAENASIHIKKFSAKSMSRKFRRLMLISGT